MWLKCGHRETLYGCTPHEMAWCALMGVCGFAEGTPSSMAHCIYIEVYLPQVKLVCSGPVCTARALLL